jgi:hypothetical protein
VYMSSLPVMNQTPAGMSIFVPYGNQAQIQVNNLSSIVYDPVGGGFAGYTIPFGHSISNIVTSGSSGSLQSGMFSTAPLTPVVYTQQGASYGQFAPSAVPAAAAMVLVSPASYSRLGAEAYGGYVAPLDNRILSPTTPVSVYPASSGNLASLVNPMGVNQPKQTWSEIPWNISPTQTGLYSITPAGAMTPVSQRGLESIGMAAPTVQATMTMGGGVVPGVAKERNFLDQLNYDIGGFLGIRASGLEQTGSVYSEATAKRPFLSAYASNVGTQPTTEYVYRNDPLAIALEGAAWAGDTLTFGLWKPGAAQIERFGQNVNPIYDTFSSNLAAVKAQKPQYDQLGSHISATQTNTLNTKQH